MEITVQGRCQNRSGFDLRNWKESIIQMDEKRLSISDEPKQQADPALSKAEVRRAALKNLALCVIWCLFVSVLFASGVAPNILHSKVIAPSDADTTGIGFVKVLVFGLTAGAMTGWVFFALFIGFVLSTGKWHRNFNKYLPFWPSGQLDPRLVRRIAGNNLLFCGAWALVGILVAGTGIARLAGNFFLATGHGAGGLIGSLIGFVGPTLFLFLFFGWILALPFLLVSLASGGWFGFMSCWWLPFSPKEEPSEEKPHAETS